MKIKIEAFDSTGKRIISVLTYTFGSTWRQQVKHFIDDFLFYDRTRNLKDCIWKVNGKKW